MSGRFAIPPSSFTRRAFYGPRPGFSIAANRAAKAQRRRDFFFSSLRISRTDRPSPPRSHPPARLDGWRCMPKVDSDLWWRAHSHPMAPAGPPPPVTTDLMRVGRQLLIQDVRPGKRPATGSESSPTSSRQGTVHDVIRAAVARAQSFAPARVEAFGRVLAEANWQTIDRLSESSQVSPVPFPPARAPTHRSRSRHLFLTPFRAFSLDGPGRAPIAP